MENMILHAHRGFAYLVLLAAEVFVVALLVAMFGYSGKVSKLLKKSSLFTMILFHTQFLIGLGMLFFKSQFLFYLKEIGMGGIMKDAVLRFSYVEHPVTMLVAAVLMTIVNKKIKTSETLNFGIVIMGLLAVVLFLLRFPFDKLFV
ncbi:hypothetical protein [Riemerella anatipestifer]|uniref:hypothetical protein n=1 Tax=Riemerella anatipestifer TaxID=34085 RepID=UPI00077B7B3D|nr:hypothetical protein [Riemerella anatipestifer]UFZ21921.1 hypothetical protein AWB56_005515 [Riemerella anatipestifer]